MLIYTIFIFDLILIILHLILGGTNSFFNLATENNLPTFYQSAKTLVAGLLLIVLAKRTKSNVWIIISGVILIFFAFDDWFQIHKRTSEFIYLITFLERRFSWVIVYFPILVLTFLAFWKIYHKIKLNRLVMIGVFCLF
ncbi:hypothetical protein A2V71_01035 [Candidatus Berkelbacteria bacterium RBG_13_40_8]|uniref:Uncharacterized protein n=1 Tax=Candidatus Berkelbacteria bacterium RBG_13_40_8 TaxID=1797467 RepID=A0A1F5DNX3_9BACT|nr:MAG: hypothetical protein A2V71_01035 [Candidatus Berkelbacteria bacterium RBG_13_40_8]